MKRILVPTDFSDNALKAALYAAEMAHKNGATIYFVHVLEPADVRIHQPFPLHDRFMQLVDEDRMVRLRKFIKPLTGSYQEIKTKIKLLSGDPVHAICRFCIDTQIDLLVMGTKGASDVKGAIIGSVTANCMARSLTPVLAIPQDYILEEPDAILFATNHFEKDTELLNKIVEIARVFTATIHVAIFEDTDLMPSSTHNHDAEELNSYIKFLRRKFPSVSFRGEILEGTSFEGAVERYEIKHEVDIIAMITYPKNFADRILGKSTTRKMAFHSRIPVLAIHHNL
jgi:nucleotide-binding universal stress UspA family protein